LRVLVTGGAGYIGSHTCKALAAAGMEPVTFDNLASGFERAVKWGPLVIGDVLETQALAEAMARNDVAAVLHFAGSTSVSESVVDPALYYRNNLLGTISVLDAMRKAGVGLLVFSSTAAVYGHAERLPVDESARPAPINPYGRSKLMAEMVLQDHAAAYGLRYLALRYFNACGADPEGLIGDCRPNATHLIPRALKAAAGRSERLEVFGTDYPTPDGTCIRDYIHVGDLAAGHVQALACIAGSPQAAAVNLGTGRGFSVLEVLSSIERVTGRPVPVAIKARRPGDSPAVVADPALARRLLGFAPSLSQIDTIIETAWRFYQANLGLASPA
jgi:UDP-arabinose 4-epimerase